MKDHETIPDEVRRFILTSIPSVPYMEAALQFQRKPTLRRSAGDISRALYISESGAAELLRQLLSAGVLAMEGDFYRFAPPEPLERMLTLLAEVYAKNLVGVTQLIHDPTEKQARQFADAFRLRKRT